MKIFVLGLGAIVLLCISSNAYAHGGGLDSSGGHNSSNGYHSHRGSTYKTSEEKAADARATKAAATEAIIEAEAEARAEASAEAKEEAAAWRKENNQHKSKHSSDESGANIFVVVSILIGLVLVGYAVFFAIQWAKKPKLW